MNSITAILPPPQSLETLDTWGTLDSLPYALDDRRWTYIGVYGLAIRSEASTGQSCTAIRKRTAVLTATATSGASCVGNGVLDLTATGSATLDAEHIGGVARAIPVAPATATSGQELTLYRIKLPELAQADAFTATLLAPYRVRMTGEHESAAQVASSIALTRILHLIFAAATATSGQELLPEYKGWNWGVSQIQTDSIWTATDTAEPPLWQGLPSGDATQWRGVVQWQ